MDESDLREQFASYETEEILARIRAGLVPEAYEIAAAELSRRGVKPPLIDETSSGGHELPTIFPRWIRYLSGFLLAMIGLEVGKTIGRAIADSMGWYGPPGQSAAGALFSALLVVGCVYPGLKIALFRYPFEKIEGFTKLMYWAAEGSLAGVASEFTNGSKIESIDSKGGTALLYAARNGQLNVVKWLLENGADPSQSLPNGHTAADLAQLHGHNEVAAAIKAAMERRAQHTGSS